MVHQHLLLAAGRLWLAFTLIGLLTIAYGTGLGDTILLTVVALFGVALPFLDLWSQVVIAGGDAVSYGVQGTLRARRRATPYASITGVDVQPSSRLIGWVLAIATDEGTYVAEAIFLTRASANRVRDAVEVRTPRPSRRRHGAGHPRATSQREQDLTSAAGTVR